MTLGLNVLNWILRPCVWFHHKARNCKLVIQAHLPRTARVLEIGSGHNPWFRSNVLCDKNVRDNIERGGQLKTNGREFVQADATDLPFPDQSFDFVFCSHVAEHIDDIEKFFREIQRVGKAGYLETPNYYFEQSIGTTTHYWALYVDGEGVLCAERKKQAAAPAKVYHGMHGLMARHPLLAACYILIPELAPLQFWWKGTFVYKILPAPDYLDYTKAQD